MSSLSSGLTSTRGYEQLSLFTPGYHVPHFDWSEPPDVPTVLMALAAILIPWSLIGWLIATVA